VQVVAIYRLLENAAFDPARVSIMVEAYECACRELNLTCNKNDPLTEILARKILEITQAEAEPDAKRVCQQSLQELGISRH
jgi:hypothetical protein